MIRHWQVWLHITLLTLLAAFAVATPASADGPPTKLGMGLYRESNAARDAIFYMRPPIVLMQDPSLKLPHEIKEKLPKTVIIGRHSVEDDISAEGAIRYADFIAEKYVSLKGAITAWTFYNEPPVQGPGRAEQFDIAQAAFTERMHRHGWKVVGFNFGVGVLEPSDYVRLFPRSLPLVDYIGVHAYGSERDFFMAGPDRDYYALRYRKIRAATLGAGYDKPFILTETGTWSAWQGRASVDEVVRDYFWLENEIARDDYVLGQIPFALDGFEWEGFRLLDTSAVPSFAQANANRPPATYATRTPIPLERPTPLPTATIDVPPTDIPTRVGSETLADARRYLPWLRELMRLPPALRAEAIRRGAAQLGISVLTVYQWLAWADASGELGPIVPLVLTTDTPAPTATPVPTDTPVPTATPTPASVYRLYLPGVAAASPRPVRKARDLSELLPWRGGPQE